jgi:hypothetical protein
VPACVAVFESGNGMYYEFHHDWPNKNNNGKHAITLPYTARSMLNTMSCDPLNHLLSLCCHLASVAASDFMAYNIEMYTI